MFKHIARILVLCSMTMAVLPAQNPPQTAPPAEQNPNEPKQVTPADATPGNAPTTVQPVDPKSFVIGSEDVLFVQVWWEPEFTRSVLVRPDGKITMPLIRELQAAGRTPEQLGKDLEGALSAYLKNPEVTVNVTQVNSKKYYVAGGVNRPGPYPLVVPTRVLDALTIAGGFKEFANQKKITVLRKGERLKFNYKDVVKGKNLEQNILLENGDYVIVPE